MKAILTIFHERNYSIFQLKYFEIVTFLFFLCFGVFKVKAHEIPFLHTLKNIYKIEEASNVTITSNFNNFKDNVRYGKRPQCLSDIELLTLNSVVDWNNFESYGIKSNKDLYVAQINNGFIASTFLGTVFDDKQQFLFQIMINPRYPIFWPINDSIRNYSIAKYKKLATVQGPTLFYHWVIDRLPSILLLKDLLLKDPEIKLIINNQGHIPQYVHEYLTLLGIPADQIIIGQSNILYFAENIYFATPFLMEPIPQKLILELRDTLIEAANHYKGTRAYNDNLVVVIQRREKDRRISNLQDVLVFLNSKFTNKGYEVIVYDASTPVAEQIQIFNNAKLIIGVMASGLTNVLFAKPDTTVIEIHPTIQYLLNAEGKNNSGNEWCWWLSAVADLNYWVLPVAFNLSDAYIHCPIDLLKQIIEKINFEE